MTHDQSMDEGTVNSGDAERQTIRELWDMIDLLLDNYNDERHKNGQKAITIKAIAESIGVPKNTLSDWLRKKGTVPDWYAVRKLVEFLRGNPDNFKNAWDRADEARLRLSQLSYRSGRQAKSRALPSLRWKEVPPIWRLAIGWTAAVVAVTIVIQASGFGTDTTTESTTRWARITNTYSAPQGKNIGVLTRTDPYNDQIIGPGYDEGVPVEILCQERHGLEKVDPTSGKSSRVWDKLPGDKWIPDLYTDLPKTEGDIPPPGIQNCPR